MRVQKLAIIFILVALSGNIGFSEDASPKRKGSEEFFRQNSAEPVRLAQNSSSSDAVLSEALRQKQAELDAAESSAKKNPTPKPAPTVKNSEVVKPKIAKPVVVEPKPPVKEVREVPAVVAPSRPVVAQPSVSVGTDDALSEALRKKQAELDAQEAATGQRATPTVKVAKPVEPKKTPAMEKAEAKKREQSEKRIKKIEAEIIAKEDAIQRKVAKTSPAPVPAEVETTRESRKKADAVNAALQAKTLPTKGKKQPISPPVELSGKEAKLSELLRKYKADEITPHDYHLERAKIIAEP